MTLNELMAKIINILPDALFDVGQDGEVIISSGYKAPKHGDNDDTELEKVEK